MGKVGSRAAALLDTSEPEPPAAPSVLAGLIDEDSLAKQLGKSVKTIRRWRREGLPCAVVKGRLRLFDVEQVRRWLRDEPEPARRRRA